MHSPLSTRSILITLTVYVLGSQTAHATCETDSDDCTQIGKWELSLGLGIGARSNPLVTGGTIPLLVVPKLSYYGKRFFIQNLDFGVTLYESDAHRLHLVATPGYDRVFFYRQDLQNYFVGGNGASSATPPGNPPVASPPPSTTERILKRKRQITYLAGPEWEFDIGSIAAQISALYEVTGRHNGTEVRAAVAAPLIRLHGVLTAAAGATWKSSAIVTYYYGEDTIYEAGPAISPFVKLSYSLPLNDSWSINALAHYEWLGSSIAHSPVIAANYVTTFFGGVSYSF